MYDVKRRKRNACVDVPVNQISPEAFRKDAGSIPRERRAQGRDLSAPSIQLFRHDNQFRQT